MEEPKQMPTTTAAVIGERPYVERRILAGFLDADQMPTVYPPALCWPGTITDTVSALYGRASLLTPRPDGGRCRLDPIEEPDALAELQAVAQKLTLPANLPVSYSWVEIRNLIAVSPVADSIATVPVVFSDDPRQLARYSLYGPPPLSQVRTDGAIYTDRNVAVEFLGPRGEPDGVLALRYRLLAVPELILVGYEQGRLYLLSAYSRVIQALMAKVDRLLCLVYYGLDFSALTLGVRISGVQPNHFGPDLPSRDTPPLLSDFLDSRVCAVVPSPAQFFIVLPSLQLHQVKWPS